MASIALFPGLTLSKLPPARVVEIVDRAELRRRFDALRDDWMEATGGELESVTLNLGALLADFEQLINGEK